MTTNVEQFPLVIESVTRDTPSAFVISYRDGHPATAGIDYIRDAVGGPFTAAFTVDNPRAPGLALTGYVHDEGLLLKLPLQLAVTYPNGYTNMLAGSMLLQGLDTDTGESVPLTHEDIQYLVGRRTVHPVFPAHGHLFTHVTHYDFRD